MGRHIDSLNSILLQTCEGPEGMAHARVGGSPVSQWVGRGHRVVNAPGDVSEEPGQA